MQGKSGLNKAERIFVELGTERTERTSYNSKYSSNEEYCFDSEGNQKSGIKMQAGGPVDYEELRDQQLSQTNELQPSPFSRTHNHDKSHTEVDKVSKFEFNDGIDTWRKKDSHSLNLPDFNRGLSELSDL